MNSPGNGSERRRTSHPTTGATTSAGRQHVAYIRRSVTRINDNVSREVQIDEVRRLAGPDASRLTILDGDWGRSARTDKTDMRLAFLGLMDDVEAGRVSTLYALSADRLARSIEWAARLWNARARTGTRIVTSEREFDTSSDTDWLLWHTFAQGNELAVRGMVEKARLATDKRRQRGDTMGALPYGWRRARAGDVGMVTDEHPDPQRVVLVRDEREPIEPILGAWGRSGRSFKRCARLLNEGGSEAKGGGPWTRATLLRLLQREAPKKLPIIAHTGRHEPIATVRFGKLLRCHCERRLGRRRGSGARSRRPPHRSAPWPLPCRRGYGHVARLTVAAVLQGVKLDPFPVEALDGQCRAMTLSPGSGAETNPSLI